jgi:hypothetical protein
MNVDIKEVSTGQPARRRKSKPDKLELLFIPLPRAAFLVIEKSGYIPALTVLRVLYETAYLDWEHKRPITLSSESLKLGGISKGQKRRALQILERYGAITVYRRPKKNPQVELNWRLPWERSCA